MGEWSPGGQRNEIIQLLLGVVLVRPQEEGLVLEQLYYADELKPFSAVPIGESEVKAEELALAVQLIQQAATTEFHPDGYQDEVRQRMLEQIEKGE